MAKHLLASDSEGRRAQIHSHWEEEDTAVRRPAVAGCEPAQGGVPHTKDTHRQIHRPRPRGEEGEKGCQGDSGTLQPSTEPSLGILEGCLEEAGGLSMED